MVPSQRISSNGAKTKAIAKNTEVYYSCSIMSPTIFRERGYRFYFLSNEETRVHVHVTSEDGEAKFWMEPIISLAVFHGFNPRRLKEIQGIIEDHKDEVIKAWQRHFGKR